MMALDLDFGPLTQFQKWILADLIGIGRQSGRSVSMLVVLPYPESPAIKVISETTRHLEPKPIN